MYNHACMEKWYVHVSRLKLVNFRLFAELDISLDERLCVLLGDNGSGKTSVLEGLSVLLSRIFPYCDCTPRLKALPYAADMVRAWRGVQNGRDKQMRAEVSYADCTLEGRNEAGSSTWLMGLGYTFHTRDGRRGVTIDNNKDTAKKLSEWKEKGIGLPVFARYGARGVEGSAKSATPGVVDYTNPFAAYIDALQPNLDFATFLNWFYEEEARELRAQRKDRGYVSPEMQAVREVLERMFSVGGMKVRNPRYEEDPKRFVMSCRSESGDEVELAFDQLSDGYRRMVALVADFARRLAIANRYSGENPLDGAGVLMIDEVDAHLHPQWQYRVIKDLRRAFPNVQLIVTTHSAEVVSTVDRRNVYILEPDGGVVRERHPEQQTDGSYPEDIAGMVMGAPSVLPQHHAYRAYLDCLAAIQEDAVDAPAYRDAFQTVLEHYGENHAFTIEIRNRLLGLERRRALREKLTGRQ